MKTKHLAYLVICFFFLCCKRNGNVTEPDLSWESNFLSSYQSIDDSVLNIKRHWIIERTGVNKVRVVETIEDLNAGGKSFKRTYQDVSIRRESWAYRLEFEHCKIDTPDQQVLLGYAAFDLVNPNHLFAHIIVQDVKTRALVPYSEYNIALKKI
jgi:hypothetical protein